MKIDEVIEAGKQLEQAVPKPVPTPAQPAKVIPFPRATPKVSPGVAANDPKFKQGIIQKYGQKAWDYVSKFGLEAAARAGVIAGAAVTPGNVAQSYNFPKEGPLKGSEINPVTSKPWTPGELAQYNQNPEKYAKQTPVKPMPGPDQSNAETARLQRQAQPIGDPVKEPAAPPKPAAPPTITPAEPAPAPAPSPAPEVTPPAQTAPTSAPAPAPAPEVTPSQAPEPGRSPTADPAPRPQEQPKTQTAPSAAPAPVATPSIDTAKDSKADWWRGGGMPGGKVDDYVPDSKLKEGDKVAGKYEPDEFDAMILRLKKLAGQGELKTVWDPVKRVYKNVPVKDTDKKQVKEYGNAQDPNNQSTSPGATGSAQQDAQTDAQQKMTQQAAQQQDASVARSVAGSLTTVLPPGTSPYAMASGITNMNDGKPLTPQERQAVSQITPLVMKAAETPALAGQLKSALQNAGVLAKQGK